MKTNLSINPSCIVPRWKQLIVLGLALAVGGASALASRPLGIDVSSYQGHPTWSSVKGAGYIFAWAKAVEGTGITDGDYTYNASNGKAAGVYMGAYDFAHPESSSGGTEENHFWSVASPYIKADGLTLQPMLDMEVFSGHVGATSYSDWVNQWCNAAVADASAAGVNIKPAIYFSACAGQFTSAISGWYSDIANYNGESSQTGTPWNICSSDDPWGSSKWDFWQYTSTGSISGISGNVDHDVYNGTSAGLVSAMVATSTGYPNYAFSSDAQGWTSGHSLTAVTWTACCNWPGIIYADQNGSDAYFYGPSTLFNGAANASVNVNVYIQNTAAPHDMQLFWKTQASNTWTASKSSAVVNYTWPGTWARMNLDANYSSWSGDIINQLRLDVDQNSSGNRFLIDHILAQTTPRYTFPSDVQGWTAGHSLSAVSWNGSSWPGVMYADQTGTDCYFYGPTPMNFWGANNDRVHVRVYPQSGTSAGIHDAQLYWITSSDGTWNQTKSFGPINFYGNDKYCDLYFNVGQNTLWNGNNNGGGNGGSVKQLRLDFDNTNHATRWIVDYVQIEHVNYDLPTITTQPSNKSVPAGSNAVFSVVGTGGNSALTYQWYKIGSAQTNGPTVISGATSASYTVTNAQPANATNLMVTIANGASSLNSAVVQLTVTTNNNIPPTITAQPTDQSITQGANAAFSVTVTGSTPLAYQWNFNGTNISGATASSYTVVSAQVSNEGAYAVTVTNAYGSATSSSANLNVNVPPSITTQPSSQTVNQGDSPTFSVVATGDAPLTYQWSLNGTNITDATDTSYLVTSAGADDVGSYTVVVANVAGSVTSATATLTVNFSPSITTDLSNQTVTQGQNATFSVVATGATPLSYIWTFNGATISSATASSYTVVGAQPTDAGVYAVTVSNFVGIAISANANLTVNVPPSVTTQPANSTVTQGQGASFSVVAAGTAPLSYQWTLNGANISGATDTIYNIASAQPADAGNYTVIITNVAGTVTSATATLTVNIPPSITTQPANQTVTQGQSATFSVAATGTAPLGYQWTFNGGNISGATASSYTDVSAQPADAGNYAVVVSNVAGSATSANATLTVNVPPSITTPPSSSTVLQGQPASFSVVAAGTAPLSYQWTLNSANIAGATTSAYNIASAQSTDAGTYAVIVTNVAGTVTSATATLTVNIPPSITTQPANQNVNQGLNATFSVVAAGTAPLTYQWRLNTLTISGATAASYTRTNCQTTDVGSYSCQVTNAYGSVISADGVLTVNTPPTINTPPASTLSSVSNSVTFSVSVSGSTPLAYQWKKNGTAISGATLSSLALSALKWTNSGSYTVVITNFVGSVTSATATLTVQQAPFTMVDGFESYALGGLDRNLVGGPNTGASNPWWGIPTLPEFTVITNRAGVTTHGGTKMIAATTNVNFCQEYLNVPWRMNAGSNYYGNIMADWWFYDTKGAGTGATNYGDYIALAGYLPVSLTNDVVSTTFTNFSQRISLGAYVGTGQNTGLYQARVVGATGGFNANGWFNTGTARTIGWHHARIVLGVPAANLAAVTMFIDNMTNSTFSYATSGTNYGVNLIEINSSFNGANTGGYFDDFTFQAANDPWIVQQPVSTTVATGGSTSFKTVAVGSAYQWQLNGVNVSGATTTSCAITNAQTANAGTYNCVITGANGTTNTTSVTLTVQ